MIEEIGETLFKKDYEPIYTKIGTNGNVKQELTNKKKDDILKLLYLESCIGELKLILGIEIQAERKFNINDYQKFIEVAKIVEINVIIKITFKINIDKFKEFLVKAKTPISTVNYYHITNNSIEIINLYITTKSLKYVTDLEKSIEFLQSTEPENVSQTIFNFRSQALAASMFRTTLSEYLSEVHKNRLLFDNYYSFKYSIVPIMILSLIIYIVILTFFYFFIFSL